MTAVHPSEPTKPHSLHQMMIDDSDSYFDFDDEEDLKCAYHEAGHAVVAWALGAEVREVTVEPEQSTQDSVLQGQVQIAWPLHLREKQTFPLALSRVCLAGPVAEMTFTGQPWHPAKLPEWRSDWDQLWRATSEIWPAPKLRLRGIEKLTFDLLNQLADDRCWYVIAACADALDAHQTLDAEQLNDLLTDLPPLRFAQP